MVLLSVWERRRARDACKRGTNEGIHLSSFASVGQIQIRANRVCCIKGLYQFLGLVCRFIIHSESKLCLLRLIGSFIIPLKECNLSSPVTKTKY